MFMNKTALFISAFVSVFLIVAALLAWIFFLRSQEASQSDPNDVSFLADFPGSGASPGGISGLFGSSVGGGTGGASQSTGNSGPEALAKPALFKIYAEPIAGFVPYETEEAGATRARFVDKATGDILEYTHESKNIARVVRETIPRVQHAVFTPNGRTVFRQYIDDAGVLVSVETPLAARRDMPGITSKTLLNGTRLIAPVEDTAFVLFIERAGGLEARLVTEGTEEVLWSSALIGWNIAYTKDRILIIQKPSYDIPGVLYVLNSKTEEVSQPFTSIRGLTAVPHPSAPIILFSRSAGNVTSLFTYNLTAYTEQALPVRTLADKCVWHESEEHIVYCAIPKQIPNKDIPDSWYRGETSFDDTWYSIDTRTGELTILYDTREAGVVIDVERPVLNKTGTALFFINKKDQSFWMLGLPKKVTPETTNEPTL